MPDYIFIGILQIRFISCVIGEVVRIHNEELIDYYSGLVPPCRCILIDGDSVCDIFAVKSVVTNTYNHFVPLLSKRGKSKCCTIAIFFFL